MNYNNIVGTCVLGQSSSPSVVGLNLSHFAEFFTYDASKTNNFIPFMEKIAKRVCPSKQIIADVNMHRIAETSFAEIWDDPEEDIWDRL